MTERKRESAEERYARMSLREAELREQDYRLIVGVDEAGRGPLAGPVCVGVCILDPLKPIYGLNDSKKLTPTKREALLVEIKEKALAYAAKLVAPSYIDGKGINAAIRLATHEALKALNQAFDYCLFDYVSWELEYPGEKLVKGDSQSNCIAAASVLAKTTRDRYMQEMDALYPDYGFARHAGYGTADHRRAILELGPCPIHRLSYIKNLKP